MIYIIILWLLIGFYLGFVCAHSIAQDDIKMFNKLSYKEYKYLYIILPLCTMFFGPIALIWILETSATWDIHWNIFKWEQIK